jgi:hypothetical protein
MVVMGSSLIIDVYAHDTSGRRGVTLEPKRPTMAGPKSRPQRLGPGRTLGMTDTTAELDVVDERLPPPELFRDLRTSSDGLGSGRQRAG